MPHIIQADNVSKVDHVGTVEVTGLRGVRFNVESVQFVSIVGPSGSGKSTLFYILGGLTRATSGRVLIDSVDFAQLSDAKRTALRKSRIGFVFQKFNLLPTLDAMTNIAIAHEIAGRNGDLNREYLDRIVELLGLKGRLHHRPSKLSGVEQQ